MRTTANKAEEPQVSLVQMSAAELLAPVVSYQREIKESHAKRIASEFNWVLFRPVIVAQYPDGRLEIADGRHSTRAAQLHAENPDVKVPCQVYKVRGEQDAAKLFILANRNRWDIGGDKLHNAKLVAGDPAAITIKNLCAANNLRLSGGAHYARPGVLGCRTALTAIYERYGEELLALTLKIAGSERWRFATYLLTTSWIFGLAEAISFLKDREDFNEETFLEKLNKIPLSRLCELAGGTVDTEKMYFSKAQCRKAIIAAFQEGSDED